MDKLIASLHPYERKIVPLLKETTDFDELVEKSGMQEVMVMRALQWLENHEVLKIVKNEEKTIVPGSNFGELPERKLLKILADGPKSMKEIDLEGKGIALGILKKNQAILMGEKIDLTPHGIALLSQKTEEEKFLDKIPRNYEDSDVVKELIKRNLVEIDVRKKINVELTNLGKELISKNIKLEVEERLTPQMLKDGTWKGKTFRRFDVEINVPAITGGKRHFVNNALQYAKDVWMDMGFEEMQGNFVQTSLWNFDALFTPQDHPVREMQDTFFVNTKGNIKDFEKIKEVHEKGIKGSAGWGGEWKEEEASKVVLRTHTTVLTAKTLANLDLKTLPRKFFSIGRCFRNEALDWSHLFEFNQTEGIVVDRNVNFRHLIGYLKQFFKKMGFEKARFRPAYFPYTEPSVEIEVFHPVHKKWLEIGGAGILRPEVVIPLLGEDIPVLAWGPGVDRLIIDYYGIKDIRELYKNDLSKEMKVWSK